MGAITCAQSASAGGGRGHELVLDSDHLSIVASDGLRVPAWCLHGPSPPASVAPPLGIQFVEGWRFSACPSNQRSVCQYAAAMSLPTTPYLIQDEDDLEAFIQLISEESLQGVVVMNRVVYTCSEDEHGDVWASSIPSDDPDDGGLEHLDDVWSRFRTTFPERPARVVHLEAW